ncbi:hypothetical protein HT031_001719 [Scenedesmus sp. PABB004]|nr:hypothetical protein HT031_001719 [Scenedesmus sp. PABB004]
MAATEQQQRAAAAPLPAGVRGLAERFDELLAALTATVEPGAAHESEAERAGARRLGAAREQFVGAADALLEQLAALQRQVVSAPLREQQQQQQQEPPPTAAAKAEPMDVDGQPRSGAAEALAAQHRAFLAQLARLRPHSGSAGGRAGG